MEGNFSLFKTMIQASLPGVFIETATLPILLFCVWYKMDN